MSNSIKPARFQSFDEVSQRQEIAPRLVRLRQELTAAHLEGFLVPLADAHRGETLPASERRLAYISGFTGSAGNAVIGRKSAALFVDGRYSLQAPDQTDPLLFEVLPAPKAKPADWIIKNLAKGSKIGFDPWLHTPNEIRTLQNEMKEHGVLVAHQNLIERIWFDRPAPPKASLEILPLERAGIAPEEKIKNLKHQLAETNADAMVLTLPETICWLFNVRGRDVPNTPLVLAFAIVPQHGKPTIFVDPDKLSPDQNQQLSRFVVVRAPDQFTPALTRLGQQEHRVQIDPAACPYAITSLLAEKGATLIEKADPVIGAKAIKNPVELAGMKQAHQLDGVALTRFLAWFDDNATTGSLSEIDIVIALENFRRREPSLVDISFDTIAGAGPNAAIVHYRVSKKSNRVLEAGQLMLVDSGGQYLSGTTDVTRTLFTGSASAQQKERYTRVLKGMIAISSARFPQETTGAQIDVLARQYLWQEGLNYNHGTGHGVGAFLSVHEGPAGIGPRYHVPLQAGMVLSNEPGFYLKGAYGIRIENLLAVIDSPNAEGFLAFETLTLAPIETRLIDTGLLSNAERDWLNNYHQRVFEQIGPALSDNDKHWLKRATVAI